MNYVHNQDIQGTGMAPASVGYSGPVIECQLSPGAKLPRRSHSTDAGADLFSYSAHEIYPGEQILIDTGIAVKIPVALAGFVYNRSSQGKRGIVIPNGVGVIDSGYRGNIMVLLKNISEDPYSICAGDRVAQLVIQPVVLATFKDAWNDTTRGTGGFGSTGQ